jgi:protocatechuate 3,4-dioxygenase beta subunit
MRIIQIRWILGLMGLLLIATACGGGETVPEVVESNEVVEATAVPPTVLPTAAPTLVSTNTPMPETEAAVAATETVPAEIVVEPTAAETTAVDPIIAAFSEPPQVSGDTIILSGQVLDVNGNPIEGAAVEIWQTDASGVYDHPNDPGTNGRDPNFQFYGTSITGADGVYSFRTLKPAAYEARPPHIHVKVKLNGATLLTTQFYFEEDRAVVEGEGLFRQAGDLGDLLLVMLTEGTDANGIAIRLGHNDLVVDIGIGSGSLTLTPAQGEGPYYPVVKVADFDSDLAVVP